MDKGKRVLAAVLIDFAMLALLIYSVYMLLLKIDTKVMKNIFTAIIVLAIPVMFYVTYMAIAGDKFEYSDTEFEDDAEEENEIQENKLNSENDIKDNKLEL